VFYIEDRALDWVCRIVACAALAWPIPGWDPLFKRCILLSPALNQASHCQQEAPVPLHDAASSLAHARVNAVAVKLVVARGAMTRAIAALGDSTGILSL